MVASDFFSATLSSEVRITDEAAKNQAVLSKYLEIGVPVNHPKALMRDVCLDVGDIQRAETYIKDLGNLASLGRLHLLKSNYTVAKECYEKLRQSDEKNRNANGLFVAYTGLGAAYEGMEDHVHAAEYYHKAIHLTEEPRMSLNLPDRQKFFDVKIWGFYRTAPYEGYVKVMLRMQKPLEASK